MLIDVHAHYTPKGYADTMLRIEGMRRPPSWNKLPHTDSPADMEVRLKAMDEAGVAMQVLSHGIMAPYAHEVVDAAQAARLTNDEYAELVQRMPERFKAFVSLPLPHVDASLAEMARGLDELGMAGVAMNCSVFQRSLAEPEFEPLYEEMDRRGCVLYYHPCASGICSPWINDYGLQGAAGTSMEDTVLVLHLILKQIPVRYPRIRIIISHVGGLIPMLLNRMDHQMPLSGLAEPPSVTARRLYYDTVGHGNPAAILCGWKAFGADHLVPGSDWPVLLSHESYFETFDYVRQAGIPLEDVEQILEKTAPELLGIS
ncbi:MAG TPA: amidohydrolase family protein [Chloroflexota bacterium]|nr:amidohydrolase family protein [Chloroflexota bacterium]